MVCFGIGLVKYRIFLLLFVFSRFKVFKIFFCCGWFFEVKIFVKFNICLIRYFDFSFYKKNIFKFEVFIYIIIII